jgi:hypothetical protein
MTIPTFNDLRALTPSQCRMYLLATAARVAPLAGPAWEALIAQAWGVQTPGAFLVLAAQGEAVPPPRPGDEAAHAARTTCRWALQAVPSADDARLASDAAGQARFAAEGVTGWRAERAAQARTFAGLCTQALEGVA